MGKIVGQTDFFNLGMATLLTETVEYADSNTECG